MIKIMKSYFFRIYFGTILFLFILSRSVTAYCEQNASDTDSTNIKKASLFENIKFLGEFYNQTFRYQRIDDNMISISQARVGITMRAFSKFTIQVYGFGRFGKDENLDFWNNRAESGIGIRIKVFSKVFLALYGDFLQGQYLDVPEGQFQPSSDKYHDVRTGIIFWYGYSKWFFSENLVSFPLKPMMEIYSVASYYQRARHNIIAYCNVKYGIEFLRIWKTSFNGYSALYIEKDTLKDYWNNKARYGIGLQIKPIHDFDLKFIFEWLLGTYYGIEGRDKNPHAKNFQDRKIGLTFWYGW